jgi:hypothetical protein
MAQRKADLAIVVRQDRRRVAACRSSREDYRIAARRKPKRVMMPSEQCRLQEDRKNAEKRRSATRRRQFPIADPQHSGEAQISPRSAPGR